MTRPRYFAILGAMRTGSNLLERTLAGCDGLVALGELFNPAFLGRPGRTEGFGATLAERDRDPIGFLEKAIAAHPGDVPGFRLFGGHDPRVIDHVARDPDCARIVLTRDPLQSFLSLAIARETGQWMLGARENRRLAKVAFDGAAFEAYRARLEDHYGRIRQAMRAAGLTAFEIDYEELGELPLVAGAARHAGARASMTRLDHPIARQNPPDPADKVTNPETLAPYLASPSPARAAPAEPRPRFQALDELLVARGTEAIYAPIPGALDDAATAFLAGLAARVGGDRPSPGLTPVQADRRRRRGAFVFSLVQRPAARLRDSFERHVATPVAAPFTDVRALLVSHYGAPADMSAAEDAGRGFDAFLAFVADSLAGRAAAPLHPAWAPQSTLLAAYAEETPVDFVARAERIEPDASYILDRLGVEDDGALARALRAAAEAPRRVTLTPEREAAARTVHARDFNRLGFGGGR